MVINIAKEYTKTPGGRFIREGEFSGEDFRIKMLEPIYEKAKANNEQLTVILDGGYGYGSSFLEEAFGGLVRSLKDPQISKIVIVSEEEPKLINDIKSYISDELQKCKG